jgi:hypothetical protein
VPSIAGKVPTPEWTRPRPASSVLLGAEGDVRPDNGNTAAVAVYRRCYVRGHRIAWSAAVDLSLRCSALMPVSLTQAVLRRN